MPIFETNSILEMPASYKGGLVRIFYILLSIRADQSHAATWGYFMLDEFQEFLDINDKGSEQWCFAGCYGF